MIYIRLDNLSGQNHNLNFSWRIVSFSVHAIIISPQTNITNCCDYLQTCSQKTWGERWLRHDLACLVRIFPKVNKGILFYHQTFSNIHGFSQLFYYIKVAFWHRIKYAAKMLRLHFWNVKRQNTIRKQRKEIVTELKLSTVEPCLDMQLSWHS